MYLDGDLIFSNGAYIADTYTSDRILVLGACISPDGTAPYTDSCVGYFDGILDDIRFYNRALSADEVTQLYRENGWPDITNPPLQRPDLSLRPSTVSQYAGMGIYNLDGSGQTASDHNQIFPPGQYIIYGGKLPGQAYRLPHAFRL